MVAIWKILKNHHVAVSVLNSKVKSEKESRSECPRNHMSLGERSLRRNGCHLDIHESLRSLVSSHWVSAHSLATMPSKRPVELTKEPPAKRYTTKAPPPSTKSDSSRVGKSKALCHHKKFQAPPPVKKDGKVKDKKRDSKDKEKAKKQDKEKTEKKSKKEKGLVEEKAKQKQKQPAEEN